MTDKDRYKEEIYGFIDRLKRDTNLMIQQLF